MALGFAGHPGLRLDDASAGPTVRREGVVWLGEAEDGDDAVERAGVTHVHLWLHAAEVVAHDFHGGAGSFLRGVRAIERARDAGVRVAVSTLLTRSNAQVLTEMPRWLHARGVVGWRVAVPRVMGEVRRGPGPAQVAGVGALDGVVPRLSVALPHALHAMTLARRLGLPAGVSGAAVCLLGPFAGVALEEPARAFAPVCGTCPARARCPGVDAVYLRRFMGDELSPRGLREPVGAPPGAWMFSGPGTLAHVATDMSEGPARTVRLPVLTGSG